MQDSFRIWVDKDMTQRLVKLKEKAREEERPHEEDKLLFGFPYQHFYRAFYAIIRELKFKDKDVHSARHTFATWLTRKVEGDRSVSEDVLGHSDPDVNKRYVHLAEELEANFNIEQEESAEVRAIKF